MGSALTPTCSPPAPGRRPPAVHLVCEHVGLGILLPAMAAASEENRHTAHARRWYGAPPVRVYHTRTRKR